MNYISEKLIKEGVLNEDSWLKWGKGEYKVEVRELYITKEEKGQEYQIRTILLFVGNPFKRKFGPRQLDHVLWIYDFDSFEKTGYSHGIYLDSRSIIQPRFTKQELYDKSTFIESGSVLFKHYWAVFSPFTNRHFYDNFKGLKTFKSGTKIKSRYTLGQYSRYMAWELIPFVAETMRWARLLLNQNCVRAIINVSNYEEPETVEDITPDDWKNK